MRNPVLKRIEEARAFDELADWHINIGAIDPKAKAGLVIKQTRANLGATQQTMADFHAVRIQNYQAWEWEKATPQFYSTLVCSLMDMLGALALLKQSRASDVADSSLIGNLLFTSGFFTTEQACELAEGLAQVARDRVAAAKTAEAVAV